MAATRILVVEDEFLIALDIAGVLEQAGHRRDRTGQYGHGGA